MGAGDSAHAEAERVRAKIESLQRYLYAQERGAEGERRTAEALSGLGPDWVVMHDIRWPGRLRANIDHIVVGPAGIFVIDTKNWAGDVRVINGALRQTGYNREKHVAGAADAGLAVAELVGPAALHVHPVLCFVAQPGMHGFVREVMMCSPDNIVAMLSTRAAVFSPAHVLDLATRLDGQLRAATTPGRGYRPSLYPNARPVHRAAVAPHPAGGFRPLETGNGRRVPSNPRRGLRLALVFCALVFFVIPLLGVLGTVLTSLVVDAVSPAPSCTPTPAAEPLERTAEKTAARQSAPRRGEQTKSAPASSRC